MKKEETWSAPITRLSPAMAPGNFPKQPEDEIVFMGDKRYGLHGEILMLVLVIVFSVFLVLLVALPCVKRNNSKDSESGSGSEASSSIQFQQKRNFFFAFPWLRTPDAAAKDCQLQTSNEIISRKFQLHNSNRVLFCSSRDV